MSGLWADGHNLACCAHAGSVGKMGRLWDDGQNLACCAYAGRVQ
jgi:hypothetical protein